ncbi:MAG: TolC family outer membrane protein [Hyphomonadaceae bacterium]|nr:TolC family outer membrane protein [Hyphomonadaceae bacterium]
MSKAMQGLTWLGGVALASALSGGAAQADTLSDALQAADANNPTLAAARADARSVQAQVAVARGNFLPSFIFGADASRQVGESEGTTIVGGSIPVNRDSTQRNWNYGLSVNFAQSLWTSGRNTGLLGQAKARAQAAFANLVGVEQQVALSVITAYVNVQRDLQAVEISSNNVEVLARRLEESRQRFEVGDVTRTDVAQAEASLAGAQAQLSQTRARLDASRADYREVVGAEAAELAVPPDLSQVMPPNLDTAIETALNLNPQIVAAEFNLRGAENAVKVARAGLLPQVSLNGQIGRSVVNGENVNRIGGNGAILDNPAINPFDNLSRNTSIGGTFRVPLYDAGVARAQTRGAKATVLSTDARLEETRRDVRQRATAAWANYQAALAVIASSRQQVAASELALEGIEQEQRVGLRTTLDVLITQQDLLNARLNLINAQRDAYVAANTLLATVGTLNARTLGITDAGADGEAKAPA